LNNRQSWVVLRSCGEEQVIVPRVNAFLNQVVAIVRTYQSEPDNKHRWAAAYLPLTLLLGREMTKQLRLARQSPRQYEYIGNGFPGDETVNDHVVPLGCIIGHLLEPAAGWAEMDDIGKLRFFCVSTS
jgi:hypothetical protein